MLGSASSPYDVIIVGGRCGGASLGAWLARGSASVCVLERCESLADAFSTHLIQSSGVELLLELGLGPTLEAAGAPMLERAVLHVDGIEAAADLVAGDEVTFGPVAIRRHLLDPHLLEAAADAGADVRLHVRAEGLLWGEGRVRGVRAATPNGPQVIHGRLVVGADGFNSTVAGAVGARRYNVVRNERFVAWGYFQLDGPALPHITLWREGLDLVFGYPCDSGLYLAIIQPLRNQLESFRRNSRATFENAVRSHRALGPLVGRADLVSRVRVSSRHEGFFRESAGPGWVLVGDAGHFKDPAMAQGMSDAFRQARRLAVSLLETRSDRDLDRATRSWARWRDRDAYGMYWMAVDAARASSYSDLELAMLDCISRSPELSRRLLADVWSHRTPLHRAVGPRTVMAAVGQLATRHGSRSRIPLVVARRAGTEVARAWSLVRRRYETGTAPVGEAIGT